jgi:putative selenate reductase molybdopterin-binding subunit
MNITLTINHQPQTLTIAANDLLLHVLRRKGFFGVKHGCETGECGACAVLLDGQPVPSCVLLAAQADGREITTIEALGERERLHPLQDAFVRYGAIQCGYCTPGLILAAHALLDRTPKPTEDEVRDAISGVLCRCTGLW